MQERRRLCLHAGNKGSFDMRQSPGMTHKLTDTLCCIPKISVHRSTSTVTMKNIVLPLITRDSVGSCVLFILTVTLNAHPIPLHD